MHKFPNGVEYTFREITLRQQAEIVAWIRSQRRQSAQEFLTPGITPEDRAAIVGVALKALSPDEQQTELNDLGTMLRVLWMSSDAGKRSPPISAEEFVESLGVVGAEELVEVLRIAQGVTTEPEEAESGPNRIDTTVKGEL